MSSWRVAKKLTWKLQTQVHDGSLPFTHLTSAFLSFKHGWDAFQPANAEQAKMMATLGISKSAMPYIGIFTILIGVMLLLPQTFLIANILNAVAIVLIMALSLNAGNYRIALIEIPFLALPLVLI